MLQELIALHGSVYFDYSLTDTINPHISTLVTEAQAFGFVFAPSLRDSISKLSPNDFIEFRRDLLEAFDKLVGSELGILTPLFKGFPYETPNHHEYLLKRLISVSGVVSLITKPQILSCGHIVTLFDIDKFSACPVCQCQVPELNCDSIPEKHVFYNGCVGYKVLQQIDSKTLGEIGLQILSRQSSINSQEKKLLIDIISKKAIDGSKITKIYNENLPFLYAINPTIAKKHIVGVTDVLRIITYLSDVEADLSLATNTRYKLRTSQKKKMLDLIDSIYNISEDMMRHREKWLRVGEILNPRKYENKYPNAASAFALIRNDHKSIGTISKVIDSALRASIIDETFIDILEKRPGEFMRKLNAILMKTDFINQPFITRAFFNCIKKTKTRMLFDILKYFRSRNDYDSRIFFPKGPSNRSWVEEVNFKNLNPEKILFVISAIQQELMSRFDSSEPKKIYIDPELKYQLLSFNQRGDAVTNVGVTKGSMMFVTEPVVRLFTWWKGNVDVDLSLVLYNESFQQITHVSFRLLHNASMRHSGDIQRAPNGAAEYIDIDIQETKKNYPNIKYGVVQLNVYRGETFSKFPCFVGYMERDSITSGKLFEPETVKLKFDVNDKCRITCPLIFDFEKNAVIFTNVQLGASSFSAANSNIRLQKIATSFITLYTRKPTIYDVLEIFAWKNGSITEQKADANMVFDSSNICIEDIYKMIDDADLKIK